MEVRLRAAAAIAAAVVWCGVPTASAQTAPGAPGALSHFDLARKDCVGTAVRGIVEKRAAAERDIAKLRTSTEREVAQLRPIGGEPAGAELAGRELAAHQRGCDRRRVRGHALRLAPARMRSHSVA